MAGNSGISAANLQVKIYADANDQVMMWSNSAANVVITAVGNLYANCILTSNTIILLQNNTPVSSSANVMQGQLWSDGSYIYYAYANNSIKRVALSSF